MALPSVPALSRCSSPLGVLSAAGATEAAEALPARVQAGGRRVATQRSSPFLRKSASSAFSSLNEVLSRQAAKGRDSPASLLEVKVPGPGSFSLDRISTVSAPEQQAVDVAIAAGITGSIERGIGLHALSTGAAVTFLRGEIDNLERLHGIATIVGDTSSIAPELSNTDRTKNTAEDFQEHRNSAGDFALQSIRSHTRIAHVDDTAGGASLPDIKISTEEVDISVKGIDAGKVRAVSEGTTPLCAPTRSQAREPRTTHPRDVADASKATNAAERDNKQGTDNTNKGATLMSDSGFASPYTPSTAPSAEPSPSLCLSQPFPGMLIRSGQAALPPSITNCCFEGQKSSNTQTEDSGDAHTCGDKQHACEKGAEEGSPKKWTEDGEKGQPGGSADVEAVTKGPSKWDSLEKHADTVMSVTPSPAAGHSSADSTSAGSSSAGSRSLEEQKFEADSAQNSTTCAIADVENTLQRQGAQDVSPALPSASCGSTRSPTIQFEVTATETQGAVARDTTMHSDIAAAAEDTNSVGLASQSLIEKEQMEAEPIQIPGRDTGGGAATAAATASEPVALSQRGDNNSDSTLVGTTTEQAGETRMQPYDGGGESNGLTDAACFLQTLQHWETDADSRCNSLLSQLSIPLPAREKLLQNTAPPSRKSAEVADVSSFLMSEIEAGSTLSTPQLTSTADASPRPSGARRNSSNGMNYAAVHTANVAAAQDQGRGIPASLGEYPRLCGHASSPSRHRSIRAQNDVVGRRGTQQIQQQQLVETLLRGRFDTTGSGLRGVTHGCHHDVHTCRSLPPAAAASGYSGEVSANVCHVRDTPGRADMPAGQTSNGILAAAVAAAAAQMLQHQMRHQVQQQQSHDPEEVSAHQTHPRQQHTRTPANWTRCRAAAALEDVLSQSSTIAAEGHRAADEESINIRRWFESFGVAGRGAEAAVAAVVKRAIDLQRRLATLLALTVRQQLNQRLLVLALALLLEKHRREPVRCEEISREQQRLLRVLETQQRQALADLPRLYGDLPEVQEVQQQLQQLRDTEWQLRRRRDGFAAAQAAAEQHACHRLSRAAEICSLSSSHRLPTDNSMRVARTPAPAAAIHSPAPIYYPSGGLLPCTSASMAEGDASGWTLCTHSQAERKGRLAERERHLDIPVFSTITETPGGGVLPPRTKYLESLTNGPAAEVAIVLSGDAASRNITAMAEELRTSRRHSRQANSSSVWRESEAPSEEKEASEREGSVLQQTQQPMIERFLAKQIERCLGKCMSHPQDAASASSGPSSTASTTGLLEASGATAGTTTETWRSAGGSSSSGTFEDEAATTARERSARSSLTAATLNSPARLCTGSSNARSDTLPEQGERGLPARGASEGSKALSSGTGRHTASTAHRGAPAAGAETCSPRPVEIAADAAAAQDTAAHDAATQGTAAQGTAGQTSAGQGTKGLILPITRSQAGHVQSSTAENSALSGSSGITSSSGSDIVASGSFTSVYSRGSNARHQNDPYPHNVMIQLIQPLPTGIKLELKSHRPASQGGAQGLGVLGGSSSSITSLSSSNAELPAPREYALRVSLTRHETKYCSFHSLHGILPAYNEAVRLRNKFAGLPFVLPTMTLEELHQRKEQLDAGRPLPGHGPHEAFMTVQERITYYKQTGMSSTNVVKAENGSVGASSSSVFGSPRSASPTSSSTAPAGGRSSQHTSPLAPGHAGSSKARNFRSSSTSSPSGVADGAAGATPAEVDSEQRGRSATRGASGEDYQHDDQTRGNAGRGGGSSGGKRGRTPSVLAGGQQEHQSSWPSTTSHSVAQQQQSDGDRAETLPKSTHVSKVASRGGKASTCRAKEEGPGSATSRERKMQLRSRTTSSSGSRSDGTTISSVTETESVKETSGATEHRNRGEKRRKISSAADDVIQCFLQKNFYKSSNADPHDGHLVGADSARRQAGSMTEGRDLKQTAAGNGGAKRNGSGVRGTARCLWDEMFCWENPLYTQQSPGETAALARESVVDTGLPTAQDVELLAQELRTGDRLSSLLDKELLTQQCGREKPPRRLPVAFMSSRRDSTGEDDWLASLHAGDRRSSDVEGGHGVGRVNEEERRTKFRVVEALPAGSSSSSSSRNVTAREPSALLALPRTNLRRGGATAEYRDDNGAICAPSGNSARKNSNGVPTQRARNVRESLQDSTWARDYKIRKTRELESMRHTEGSMASASENARDEKKGNQGDQEVDVNEEEARHLSELLLGTGMFGEMSRCSDDVEEQRLAREETRTAQGETRTAQGSQSRIVDTAVIPSAQQQM